MPDEAKTFSDSLVLDVILCLRHVHTLYMVIIKFHLNVTPSDSEFFAPSVG